jgi:lipoprotein-releasing system permease protein
MSLKIEWTLMRRFFWNQEALSTRSSLFAMLGIALGVSVLYVALSVMSGFEKTLKQSLMDVRGHLTVVKRTSQQEPWQELFKKVQNLDSRVLNGTPFLTLEGVTAGLGIVQGVLIQGLDEKTFDDVIKLRERLVQGKVDISKNDEGVSGALIGTDLASRMGKTIGDKISVVVPRFGDLDTSGYRRSVGQFEIRGILDLGKFEWNERLVVIRLPEAQKLGEVKNRYAGVMLTVEDPELAEAMSTELVTKLGAPHWVRDWKSEHENTFAAVKIERRIIFFVVFIILIVAAFSLASNLLLQTLQKSSEIAVLKSLGMRRTSVIRLFLMQGLFLGLSGIALGFLLGGLFRWLLTVYQSHWGLIAGSVYKVSHIDLSVRSADLFWITFSTLFISVVSGLIPAIRAAQKLPGEGLKYE